MYNGKKYNIDYDDTTNTLVIFEADGVSVDATYVNGQKQVINENSVDISTSNKGDDSEEE